MAKIRKKSGKSGRVKSKPRSKIPPVEVSCFSNAKSKTPALTQLIGEVLQDTKSGVYKKEIDLLRSKPPDEYKAAKEKLPGFTPAGTFSYGDADNLIDSSGFACLDFDKFKNQKEAEKFRDSLKAYPYIYSAFVSPGGCGVKALVRIKNVTNEAEYKQIYGQLLKAHPTADPVCSNLARLCFVSYDAGLWINEKATVFKAGRHPRSKEGFSKAESIKVNRDMTALKENVEILIKRFEKKKIVLPYNEWFRIGCALADGFGEEGLSYFLELTQFYTGKVTKTAEKQFKDCLKEYKGKKIKIESFFTLMEPHVGKLPKTRRKQYAKDISRINLKQPKEYLKTDDNKVVKKVKKVKVQKKVLPNTKIFADLLKQVKEIEFPKKATLAQYRILTIEYILDLAARNSWGLCRYQGFLYLFNSQRWVVVDETDLMNFLGKVAEKLSVPWDKSRDYEFRDKLLKQFEQDGYFSPPEKTESIRIPLLNGTYDFSERKLRKFDRNDFLTYQLPFAYNGKATAPKFKKFLDKVLPDKKCQYVLAEYLGWLFCKDLKLEGVLFLYGSGANGKSVVFDIVSALLGKENISNYSLSKLTVGYNSDYYIAQLANKLLNYASEISGDMESDKFKTMASQEPLGCRRLYQDPIVIYNYARFIFNCNVLPKNVEFTNAYFRRFKILPFTVTIPEKEQDKELANKIIRNELPGIFNWVLKGLDRLLKNKKFTECNAMQEQVEVYKKESDSVAMYLEDYEYGNSSDKYEKLKTLYKEYRVFCNDDGCKPLSKKNFKHRLTTLGYNINTINVGNVVYVEQSKDRVEQMENRSSSEKIFEKEDLKTFEKYRKKTC